MALDWPSLGLAALESGEARPIVLFRMATEPVVRLWGGVGDLQIPADLVESEDYGTYKGAGELLSLPAVSQLINGIAERVTFGITGTALTGEVAALASTSAADIRGAVVNLGFQVLGGDWQALSPVAWLWDGIADSLSVDKTADESGAVVRTISVSVGSVMTGRRRPSPAYWTDPDQRRRSATDRFCDRVRLLEAGSTKVWPE